MDEHNFQYCQKIVVYSKDEKDVLLCKRKNESDFDGTFSFIGGKMKNLDKSIIEGIKREKNEEVGRDFKIKIYPDFSVNILFTKKDGNSMILPHYYSIYQKGDIKLGSEYSEHRWVNIETIKDFEPKIHSIPKVIQKMEILRSIMKDLDSVII